MCTPYVVLVRLFTETASRFDINAFKKIAANWKEYKKSAWC